MSGPDVEELLIELEAWDVEQASGELKELLEQDTEYLKQVLQDATGECVQDDEKAEEDLRAAVLSCVNNGDTLEVLDSDMAECDSILANVEGMLATFQKDISGISSKISKLQGDSSQMSLKLQNRQVTSSALVEQLDQFVVDPQAVRRICDGEVDDLFLEAVRDLAAKSKAESTLPAALEVKPYLEKLKLRATTRIREALMTRITSLTKPKTNIQILQRNVLVHMQELVSFLRETAPVINMEVRSHYVGTMCRVYHTQFKTYCLSLSRIQLQCCPTGIDLLIPPLETGASAFSAGLEAFSSSGFKGLVNMARQTVPFKERGNVFSLSGREKVLGQGEQDAIVPHLYRDKKCYPEQLFHSEHTLLVSTATSEYLFLKDFFTPDNDGQQQALFQDVFGKTLGLLQEQVEQLVNNSWDAVGLQLMVCVAESCQRLARRRSLNCLETHFEKLLASIKLRFVTVVEANIQSLVKANPRTLNVDSSRPHVITRRFAELAASLTVLSKRRGAKVTSDDVVLVNRMFGAAEKLLESMAKELADAEQPIFTLNNIDLMVTIFQEHQLDDKNIERLTDLRSQRASAFVEAQLRSHFAELVRFVQLYEGNEAPAVDPGKTERLAAMILETWRPAVESIERVVLSSFMNFTLGNEILKQVLTQLMLYHSRFQKIVDRNFPEGAPFDMVSSAVFVDQIKKVANVL